MFLNPFSIMKLNTQLTNAPRRMWRGMSLLTLAFAVMLSFTACQSGGSSGDEEQAENAVPDTEWLTYGNDYAQTRYSPLDQVNTDNVSQMQLSWEKPLNIEEAQECTPIMVNKTLYVTTSNGPKYVYAFDAKTGAQKWVHEFNIPGDVARFACCGVVNRGVSYADGKIVVGRLDGNLTALDANTGEEIWTTNVVDYKQGSVITSPPTIVGTKVITGFGGGEYGARGYLSAYDLNTGEQVWKTFTIPTDEDDPAAATWKGDTYKYGGGVPWFVGSYDKETNTVYYGTSNPSPWNSSVRGPATSDYGDMTNLYTAATIAFDVETGEMKWHFQTTPYDAWDYDGVNEKILADLTIDGKETPVLMTADRNGFIFTLNRNTGKLISADKFVKVNWAEKFDLETGRPVENPAYRLRPGHDVVGNYPSLIGGKNWQPMAFSQETGLLYIPANHLSMDFHMAEGEIQYQRGYFYLGAEWEMESDPDLNGNMGEIIAWDPVKGEKVWGIPQKLAIPGGPIATGGNLVFFGNLEGMFHAVNAKTGEVLWSQETGTGVGAAPMTYAVDGKQYVAIVAGRPTVIPGFIGGEMGEAIVNATPAGGKIMVFGIGEQKTAMK
jgi:alcohol dehydrogenase (cytochrome c)